MAFERDDLDTGLLVTIGLAGALIVVAGSFFAAGIYWDHRNGLEVERTIEPAIERARQKRDAELATLQTGPMTIEQAMARVAEERR